MLPSRTVTAALLATAMLGLWPGHARAHQQLLRAEPADGARVDATPRELRLIFNEAVNLTFTAVTVLRADGDTVRLGELRTHPDSAAVLIVSLEGGLVAGPVTVQWRTASADGHPVRGELTFIVEEGADGLAPDPEAGEAAGSTPAPGVDSLAPRHGPSEGSMAHGFGAGSPGYVLVRWIGFIALLGVFGAVAFALLVLPLARRRHRATLPEALVESARGRAAALGLASALVLVGATLARLYAQSVAMHGGPAGIDGELVRSMLTDTVWGWAWMIQVGAAVIAAAAFAGARRGSGAAWGVAAAAALGLSVTPALSGHPAAMEGAWRTVAIVADAVHVLAAGGWMGTLLVLTVGAIPAALRLEEGRRVDAVATLVRAFSPAALTFAGVLVATGVVATLLHSGSLGALVASDYGRVLLIKLLVFLLVLAAGAWNYLRVQPRLTDAAATRHLRRSAAVELALATVVLLVTAVLVATARPFEGG